MVDDRDSGGGKDFAATKERFSLGGHDVPSLVTGAVVGAVVGAAFTHFFLRFLSGDEPPIRIKGGSMRFDLVTQIINWKKDGSAKKWKLSDGTRGREEYNVIILVKPGSSCSSQTVSGKKVRVQHSDGSWVQIKGTGNHTKLESSADLTPADNDRALLYSANGHIDKVEVDSFSCSFGAGELEDLLLTEC